MPETPDTPMTAVEEPVLAPYTTPPALPPLQSDEAGKMLKMLGRSQIPNGKSRSTTK